MLIFDSIAFRVSNVPGRWSLSRATPLDYASEMYLHFRPQKSTPLDRQESPCRISQRLRQYPIHELAMVFTLVGNTIFSTGKNNPKTQRNSAKNVEMLRKFNVFWFVRGKNPRSDWHNLPISCKQFSRRPRPPETGFCEPRALI